MKIPRLLQITWAATLNNVGPPYRSQAPVLPTLGLPSLSLSETQRLTKQTHTSRGEGHSSPHTRNTNEENFVNVLIPQEKPRASGEFTRKRLIAAKYAKG